MRTDPGLRAGGGGSTSVTDLSRRRSAANPFDGQGLPGIVPGRRQRSKRVPSEVRHYLGAASTYWSSKCSERMGGRGAELATHPPKDANAKLEASSMGDVYELRPVSLYRFCVTVEDVVQIPSPATFAPSEMSRVQLGRRGRGLCSRRRNATYARSEDGQPIATRKDL
jgi:hypothetical protein